LMMREISQVSPPPEMLDITYLSEAMDAEDLKICLSTEGCTHLFPPIDLISIFIGVTMQ